MPAAAMPATVLLALAAGTFVDPAAIDHAVAAFTGLAPGEPGGAQVPVDRRLKLAACEQPLALSWHTPARGTVLVQCPGGWRLYVPIRSAAAGMAAAPAIQRGDPVTIRVPGTGFSLTQPGEALESGSAGAWIRVRGGNAKAPPLRARVIRSGLVELPLD